jgi:hemoglobin/transferrin/lactoferrin receptor protein
MTPTTTQTSPAKASLSQPKNKQPYELSKIVVTPSRGTPQNILQVPQQVDSITQDDISSTVKTDVNEYLQTVPGIGLAPSSGGDTTSNNADYWNSGFSVRGLGGQRVLVLTDGIRQSGQGIGYGGGNLSLYDLESVDHIEVLQGPASVLYGTDAFGGVIQVFSRQPTDRDGFGINGGDRISYDGSRNAETEGAYIDVGDKNWGLVMSGSYENANDPILPGGRAPVGGGYFKQGESLNFVYHPTDNGTLRIFANIVTARDIDVFNETNWPGLQGAGDFYFRIPFYQRKMIGTEYGQTNASGHIESWKIGIYTSELNRQFEYATPTFPGTDLVHTNDTVHTTELQPQVVFDFDPHTITVGSDLGYDDTYLPQISSQTGYDLKADASQQREGFYAQDRWDLGSKDFLILGGRYDYFSLIDHTDSANDATDGGLSGSLSYTHMITPQTSLYGTLATGFRSPDLDERYQQTIMDYFGEVITINGNPDLKPERCYSLDLGAKHEGNNYGDFTVSAFYDSINNFIGLVQTQNNLPFSVTDKRLNVGTVDLYGFEAAWKTSDSSPWKNYLNVSRTWNDENQYLSETGIVLGQGIGYQFKDVGVFRSVTPQWMSHYVWGSTDTVNNNTFFPAFFEADVQISTVLKTSSVEKIQWIVGVKNIFNRLYEQPFMQYYAPGRGIFTSLNVEF